MKTTHKLLVALFFHFVCFSQVNELEFNHKNFDASLLPRTNINPMSLRLLDNYDNGGPTRFGSILEIYGLYGHQTSQLYFGGYDNSKIRYREAFYNENTWGNWITLLDSKNDIETTGSLKITGSGNSSILNGKVGIGTTTPSSKLEVYNNDTASVLKISNNAPSIFNTELRLGGTNTFEKSAIISTPNAAGWHRQDLYFCLANGNDDTSATTADAAMVIKSYDTKGFGYVGIGTTTPSEKLEVTGNAKINGNQIITGKIGIGTPTPGAKLEVLNQAAGTTSFKTVGVNGYMLIDNVGSGENYFNASKFHEFQIGNASVMKINTNGYVGIGSQNPDEKLTVKGKIHAEEIRVDLLVPADYVFQKYYTGKSDLKPTYTMPTLAEVAQYTKANNHLPNVPSAQEIKDNGLELGKMNNLLLQKIEELTLYLIEQNKKIEALEGKIEKLNAKK